MMPMDGNSGQQFVVLALLRFLRLFILICFCLGFAFVTEKRKRPLGVTVLASLLLAASADQAFGLMNFSYYAFSFQQLTFPFLVLRYIGSLARRLFEMVVAYGALGLKEWARKGILILGIFSLVAIPFKHPLAVFENLSSLNQAQFPGSQPINPLTGVVFFGVIDLVFYGFILFYFTRRPVRDAFTRPRRT